MSNVKDCAPVKKSFRKLPKTYLAALAPVTEPVVPMMSDLAPVVILPLVKVSMPFTVLLPEERGPPALLLLLIVRLLKEDAPLMLCAAVLDKVTVPDRGVKVPLFAQLPLTVNA